jgi:hypothetical protein
VGPALVSRFALTLAAVTAAVPVSDADMRAATDGILGEIVKMRRLSPRNPPGTLERRVETPPESRARRGAELAAAAVNPELAARLRLWERLGLVPAGTGPDKILGPSLDAAATASYDPLGRRLFVPAWIPLAEQRPALAHALAHALDDARFSLRDFLGIDLEGRRHLDGDAERARLALVEGDAALTALELDDAHGVLTGAHSRAALASDIAGAPAPRGALAWTRTLSTFAHADGLAFVARVRARRTWSAADALWADPPRSSEQVLHPEKYDAHEPPAAIATPKAAALGAAREVASDVLGELGVRAWLAPAVPGAIAERAAAGWGGDRAILFATPDGAPSGPDAGTPGSSDGGAPSPAGAGARERTFVLWSTVWDDVTDAEDFARAAAPALARLAGGTRAGDEDPHRFAARGPDGTYALAWRGSAVALLVSAPESAVPALEEIVAPPPAPARRARPRANAPRPPRAP